MTERYPFIPYQRERLEPGEMARRAAQFQEAMANRRSLREFSSDPVPKELIETAIRVAGGAPSGANRQPWTFVLIDDPALKSAIRNAAEAEERQNYEGGRFPPEWLEALAPLGTFWHKSFLETAPWLVVVFRQDQNRAADGSTEKNYYVSESVGIACGFFIAAIHQMGLATLTHTPSPMGFLRELLNRPVQEKPYLLLPIGFPAEGAVVPDISRKSLDEIVQWNAGS
ncbi:MAG: nitroreductase family protein [Candidatus Eisenbacteria bacterium]|nr:nitroreductase family protein [Candidatus Eisenbacteria bacterium]